MVVAVVPPYHTQVRRPSGPVRVLPRRDGVVQAVVGAWTRGVEFIVTSLAPRPAARRLVAAPRRCVASCAGVRI